MNIKRIIGWACIPLFIGAVAWGAEGLGGGGSGGGSGTVTSVGTGNGLTGGPITTTGTVSLPTATAAQILVENAGATAFAPVTLSGSGDCATATLGSTGVLTTTCLSSNGNAFTSAPFGAALNLSTYAGAIGNSATGTTQSAGDNSTKLATTAYADRTAQHPYIGPYPIAFEGVGQASGASLSRNAPSGPTISANNDMVVIMSDADTTGISTLTCGGGCTNTFTKRITDSNVTSGEFFNVWTGLAGSETSYTVTATSHNVFFISIGWFHKLAGTAIAFDASGGCVSHTTSTQVVMSTPTITTTQANATAVIFASGSGNPAPMPAIFPSFAYSPTVGSVFASLGFFTANNVGATGYAGLGTYQAPATGAFPAVYVPNIGGSALNSCAIDIN